MKNVQVIDGAQNAVYDVFSASDADFGLLFGPGEDVAFIEDVFRRHRAGTRRLQAALSRMWKRRIAKRDVLGIHGTLFFGLQEKKVFYPTLRDEDARNPNGTPLRQGSRPIG